MIKNKFIRHTVDLLYPRRCMVCHKPAPFGEYICPECEASLPVIESGRCRKCGKPVEDFEKICPDCQKTEHIYERGIGIYRYEGVMKEAISYMKYRGRREYGETMGVYAARSARTELLTWHPDVIIPVPIHPKKLEERGFNQAEVIAEGVSYESGIPLAAKGLIRKDSTAAMKNLTVRERSANLARAFKVGEDLSGYRSALIVDDIYTTGATIDGAATVLSGAGLSQIYFLSVCIGSGFMVSY